MNNDFLKKWFNQINTFHQKYIVIEIIFLVLFPIFIYLFLIYYRDSFEINHLIEGYIFLAFPHFIILIDKSMTEESNKITFYKLLIFNIFITIFSLFTLSLPKGSGEVWFGYILISIVILFIFYISKKIYEIRYLFSLSQLQNLQSYLLHDMRRNIQILFLLSLPIFLLLLINNKESLGLGVKFIVQSYIFLSLPAFLIVLFGIFHFEAKKIISKKLQMANSILIAFVIYIYFIIPDKERYSIEIGWYVLSYFAIVLIGHTIYRIREHYILK
ncbi:MAG: hypothetical protein NT103_03885 [Campylobacterales bacterium]|nr:hypothetical protein [Campylobacterales bacterium]